MQTGGNTTHTHTHNRCITRGHTTQHVVGEDVLSLLYHVSAGFHCVGLNYPVPSTDQHLEGGHGRITEQYARTPFHTDTKLASFSGY